MPEDIEIVTENERGKSNAFVSMAQLEDSAHLDMTDSVPLSYPDIMLGQTFVGKQLTTNFKRHKEVTYLLNAWIAL